MENGQNDDQNPGGEGTPAGSQKSSDDRLREMEEAQKAMLSQFQSTQEELKRVSNLNQVLMSRLQKGEGQGDSPNSANDGGMNVNATVPIKLRRDFSKFDPTENPQEFAQNLILEAAEHVTATVNRSFEQRQSAEQMRRMFYEKNSDLVGFEVEVGHFSGQVQSQNPTLPFEQAAEEIAKRTREYIRSKGYNPPGNSGAGTPPHVLPPSGIPERVPIKPPEGQGDKPFNPDESYKDSMKDYMSLRNGERDRDATKTGKA